MKTYKLKGTVIKGTVYDGLTVEVTEDQIKALLKDNPDLLKPEVKGRYFFPKVGEMYWCINSFGSIFKNKNSNQDIDKHFISIGNCYRTKEEAELALKKQQAIVRCWKWQQENAPFEPDWGDERETKYFAFYKSQKKEIEIGSVGQSKYEFTLPYFKSEEDCEAFREANKEDLLLLFTK